MIKKEIQAEWSGFSYVFFYHINGIKEKKNGGKCMIKNRYCKRCGHKVNRETVKGLRKEYPYYCPHCDQNMYRFEIAKR